MGITQEYCSENTGTGTRVPATNKNPGTTYTCDYHLSHIQ